MIRSNGAKLTIDASLWVEYGGVAHQMRAGELTLTGQEEDAYLKVLNHFGRVYKLFVFENGGWVDTETGGAPMALDPHLVGRAKPLPGSAAAAAPAAPSRAKGKRPAKAAAKSKPASKPAKTSASKPAAKPAKTSASKPATSSTKRAAAPAKTASAAKAAKPVAKRAAKPAKAKAGAKATSARRKA